MSFASNRGCANTLTDHRMECVQCHCLINDENKNKNSHTRKKIKLKNQQ